MDWTKVSTTVNVETGARTTRYASGTGYNIESRKRPIAHANREGHWMFTSYYLISPDGTEKEYYRLSEAKEAVERMRGEEQP